MKKRGCKSNDECMTDPDPKKENELQRELHLYQSLSREMGMFPFTSW